MTYHFLFFATVLGVVSPLANAQSRTEQIAAVMQQYYGAGNQPGGVLVIREADTVVFGSGYGAARLVPNTEINLDTRFRMASVSKQFTAMCINLLAESGKLSMADPLSRFFPELADAVGAITVRQLLNHTSGIWDYEALIPDTQATQVVDADVLKLVSQQPQPYFTPGSQFRYSNTGYCLLSLIVARVSGQPYAEFVRQRVFVPLGMDGAMVYEADAAITNRAYGYHPAGETVAFADQSLTSAAQGDGGVYLSAREYLLWTQALLENDFPSTNYRKRLAAEKVAVGDGVHYSMGWFIGKTKSGSTVLFHSGESTGFHNIVYLDPDRQLTIALFTNRDDMGIAGVFDRIAQLMGVGLRPEGGDAPVSLFRWLNEVY